MNNMYFLFCNVIALLIAFTIKEFTRAFMASQYGDKTPEFQGRLTLNPLSHIDFLGFFFMIAIGFGWSKPVNINRAAFKNPKKDALNVNVAALLSNLILATLIGIIMGLLSVNYNSYTYDIVFLLQIIITVNVNLFVFYMLPLPGLDGFKILQDLFPKQFYKIEQKLYAYYNIILLIIIFLLGPILSRISNIILNLIYTLCI